VAALPLDLASGAEVAVSAGQALGKAGAAGRCHFKWQYYYKPCTTV
jgi:hypothetical protein